MPKKLKKISPVEPDPVEEVSNGPKRYRYTWDKPIIGDIVVRFSPDSRKVHSRYVHELNAKIEATIKAYLEAVSPFPFKVESVESRLRYVYVSTDTDDPDNLEEPE